MTPEREAELRELGLRLIHSKRHGPIGTALLEVLSEYDQLRQQLTVEPSMSYEEACAILAKWQENELVATAIRPVSTDTWKRAVEAQMPRFPVPGEGLTP